MKRFNFEDNEDPEEETFFEGELPEESSIHFFAGKDILDALQVDLAEVSLNQALLAQAIAMAQKSWFWSLYSTDRQLSKIKDIYRKPGEILEDDEYDVELQLEELDEEEDEV